MCMKNIQIVKKLNSMIIVSLSILFNFNCNKNLNPGIYEYREVFKGDTMLIQRDFSNNGKYVFYLYNLNLRNNDLKPLLHMQFGEWEQKKDEIIILLDSVKWIDDKGEKYIRDTIRHKVQTSQIKNITKSSFELLVEPNEQSPGNWMTYYKVK